MSEAKFTPAPWAACGPSRPSLDSHEGGDYAIKDGGTNILAEVFYRVSADRTMPAAANARLIAAAPDLLAALQAIIAQYDAAPDGPLGKGFTNGPFLDARAAIALALGKESDKSEWSGDNAIITSPDGPNECTDCNWIGRTPSGCPKCGGSVVMRDGANHG